MNIMSALFDEEFRKKLSRLKFMVKKILLAGTEGEKTGRKKGGTIEFSDFRKYASGDETRYIDWNVFARTEKLFIKEFSKEEDFPVYLVLDLTTSMQPRPIRSGTVYQATKLNQAKRLIAALGYIALVTGNRVRIAGFSDDALKISNEWQGEDKILEVMKFLEPLPARGRTNLIHTLMQLNKHAREKGLLILVSDLMQGTEPDYLGAGKGLIRFTNRGFEASVIHLLSREEENPPFSGWVKLKDSETGEIQTLWLGEKERDIYLKELTAFSEEWRRFCLHHGIKYFRINNTTSTEDLVLNFLKRGGLLR